MGKLKTFEIFVDNQDGQVAAGETLRGEVVLETTEDIDVVEIRVEFKGRCQVQWADPKSSTPMAEIHATAVEPVVAEEEYINDCLKLFPGHECTDDSTPLKKGSHTFDFRFHVPAHAPSSFSGSQGHVRYSLRAAVERTWKTEVNKRDVTVVSHLDLNTVPAAKTAVFVSDTLKLSSFLFPSGECAATMEVSKKGFTPGEAIPVDLSIDNRTHHELYKVKLLLRMITQYRAYGDKFNGQVVLAKSRLGKIPAGRSFQGCDRSLRVPLCPPSRLPGCNLISVCYQLELKIRPAMLTLKRLRLSSEIIVGTIAVDRSLQTDRPPDYWTSPPPSYEEVIASDRVRSASLRSLDGVTIPPAPPAITITPTSPTSPTTPSAPGSNDMDDTTTTTECPAPAPESVSTSSPAGHARAFRKSMSTWAETSRPLKNDNLRLTVLKTRLSDDFPFHLRPRANTEGTLDTCRTPGR
ncbi:arrestin domain-containing protein 17-like isoform X1 [Pomacea canaliculata]|uniref:arrestin domain-containing protein 17-like isoform X1 n=2 Tax=Pomacea canaliculata TaxID=400727 RepID=UPI000D73E967|nr:arrestin domain-containing protein 17-like isoform X1 [Pomacea canaliculata]XP_025078081.1 arrestin domain-containing protein 17-like isoform X1 [Pomacea canaliculata]